MLIALGIDDTGKHRVRGGSVAHLSAQTIVAINAQRMQIKQAFRDTKNAHVGLGLFNSASRTPARLAVLALDCESGRVCAAPDRAVRNQSPPSIRFAVDQSQKAPGDFSDSCGTPARRFRAECVQ